MPFIMSRYVRWLPSQELVQRAEQEHCDGAFVKTVDLLQRLKSPCKDRLQRLPARWLVVGPGDGHGAGAKDPPLGGFLASDQGVKVAERLAVQLEPAPLHAGQ